MIYRPMNSRHDRNSVEMRVFDRFRAICSELSESIDPLASHARHPALLASHEALRAAGIALLEAAPIAEDDWDAYLEKAYKSGDPQLLEAAVRIMPLGCQIKALHAPMTDLVRTVPIEHILIADRAGIAPLMLVKGIVQSAITRNDAVLQDAVLESVRKSVSHFSCIDWFSGLREQTLQKGAGFLARLLLAYSHNSPEDVARGLKHCIDNERHLHALALYMAGARPPADAKGPLATLSNHQLLGLIAPNKTLAEVLADPGMTRRIKNFLAQNTDDTAVVP